MRREIDRQLLVHPNCLMFFCDDTGHEEQLLDKINAGQKPKPPDVTQPDAYRPAFEEIPGDNWKTM
jgi:hypothetical protein